jgi:tetratricopeptide (TPR) repeat protein
MGMNVTEPSSAHQYAETEDSLQLNLFSWDRVQVGEGLEALAFLDFRKAEGIFKGLLSRFPGHPEASAGLTMTTDWAAILETTSALEKHDAAAALWAATKGYTFTPGGEQLRKALIRRAIGLFDGDPHLYIPPDVCLGRLFLEVEEYEAAERALGQVLNAHGPHGGLMVCLGNCLFRQGKRAEARFTYARAFLLAPWGVERDQIEDRELVQVIVDEDPYWAAVYGWLRRLLPLMDVQVESPRDKNHEAALLVYESLRRAETARTKGDHDAMVEQRRRLKRLAPGVFLEYMGRLETWPSDPRLSPDTR